MDLTLQTLLGGICLLSGDHLYEAKATRLLGVGVAHDVALLDFTVLLEQTCDLLLAQGGVDAGDEEVGALVAALFRLMVARLRRRATQPALAGSIISIELNNTYRLSRSLGEALRARALSLSRPSRRGDLLRSRS